MFMYSGRNVFGDDLNGNTKICQLVYLYLLKRGGVISDDDISSRDAVRRAGKVAFGVIPHHASQPASSVISCQIFGDMYLIVVNVH